MANTSAESSMRALAKVVQVMPARLRRRVEALGAMTVPAGWAAVEDIGTARCRLCMTTDSLDWPTMTLGVIGAEFHVLSLPELLDRVRDWGHRFSRATRTARDG